MQLKLTEPRWVRGGHLQEDWGLGGQIEVGLGACITSRDSKGDFPICSALALCRVQGRL